MKNPKKILIYAIIVLCLSTVIMNIYFWKSISYMLIKVEDIPEVQDISIMNDYPLVIYLKDIHVWISIYRTLTICMFVLCAVLLVSYFILQQKEKLKE